MIALIHEFEGTKWPSNDSPKQCHVEYSRLQGKDELLMEYERHAKYRFRSQRTMRIKLSFFRFL